MNTGLEGKIAMVTGGGSGIGKAVVRALAQEGCRVVIADLAPGASAVELSDEFPEQVELLACDLSSPDECRRAVLWVAERLGGLDVLVTSAGIYETAGVAALTDEEWERTISVNLGGTFMCAQAALPVMAAGGWGRIVTLSSMGAQTGGGAAGPAYVSSKAAILGLTKSLAKHAGPQGVTVNCVAPGFIDTPMTGQLAPEDRESIKAITPLRRNGTPEDVAAVVVMLASEGAGFITGEHINVNGGLVME